MAQLLNLAGQVLAGGIGGVVFLGTWTYMVMQFLTSGDFAGLPFGVNWLRLPIPTLF